MGMGSSQVDSDSNASSGRERNPVLVVVLSLFTFGIYAIYWIWSTSKEMDRFDPHRKSPFAIAKWAVPLPLASLVLGLAGLMTMVAGTGSGSEAGLGGGILLFGLAALLFFAGAIAMLFVYWRLWKGVEAHERSIGAPTILSPGLMMVLWLVPFLNLIGAIYIPYRTQEGLNRIWAAADEGYEASPPRPAGGFEEGADREVDGGPAGEST